MCSPFKNSNSLHLTSVSRSFDILCYSNPLVREWIQNIFHAFEIQNYSQCKGNNVGVCNIVMQNSYRILRKDLKKCISVHDGSILVRNNLSICIFACMYVWSVSVSVSAFASIWKEIKKFRGFNSESRFSESGKKKKERKKATRR